MVFTLQMYKETTKPFNEHVTLKTKRFSFLYLKKMQQTEKIIKSFVGEHLCLPLAEEMRLIMFEEKRRRAKPGAAVRQNDSLYPY